MQYRKFGKHDIEVSALGFGCMRFPTFNNDEGQINEEEATRMLRYAIDNGVNYVDTAYPYHKGTSESVVGRALKDGYREKVYLATKMPLWLVNDESDYDRIFNEQLERLQTDYIDMYLLHAIRTDSWKKIKDLNLLDKLTSAKKEGKIKYAGFSFHDNVELFKEIVDSYDWDFCQIQYNFMDEKHQAGKEGLLYAASKGIAVIIMEPLRGGRLVINPPQEIKDIYNEAPTKRTPTDWALRWVLNHPGVTMLLSGMSAFEHVEENMETVSTSFVNTMTEEELNLINRVQNTYHTLTKVGCTNCQYCMPCPFGVDIPNNFTLYNQASMYNTPEHYTGSYSNLVSGEKDASRCADCGKCEDACPQNIKIREELKAVHEMLSK